MLFRTDYISSYFLQPIVHQTEIFNIIVFICMFLKFYAFDIYFFSFQINMTIDQNLLDISYIIVQV